MFTFVGIGSDSVSWDGVDVESDSGGSLLALLENRSVD